MHSVLHLLFLAAALSGAWNLPVLASDCPLDFSWSNFTTVVSTCSDQFQRGKCCRYINALIAVSVAKYAAGTGQLGVPPAFSDMCISSVSEILTSNRVNASATSSCGLGLKIVANYQCKGRSTVLEMLQAPNFTKVVKNCQMPLSDDTSCRKCINAVIAYLHHLIGVDDNVTLSTCRNAAFVTLANQDAHASPVDLASCFFSVRNIGPFTGNNISGNLPPSPPPSSSSSTEASPGPASSENAAHPLTDISIREHHHPYRLGLMQEVGIAITVVAIMLLIILTFLIRKKRKQLGNTASHPETFSELPSHGWKHQEGQPSMFRRFSYKETRKATCNFSSVIGRGGFGTVYKAHFSDGFVAAVKRMDKASHQGEDEFCKEVDLLGRLHHRHLVSLRGFCTEKHERFLMYEYMENGSLKDHLHSPGGAPLSWLTRLRIAMDVANALEYLHFYCDPPLCHRDIKSSNILLDENFVAKVADFGLAHASRIGSIKFEPVNTDIRGTPGYMDPEYAVTQELTEKSDLYSYGVLLLELVTGRQAVQDKRNLVEWSQKFMETEFRIHEMVDPLIADTFDLEQLKVVAGIAQWCTKVEGRARPSIKQVLRMLYEGLDPVQRDFMEAIGDEDYEDGISGGSKTNKGKSQLNAIIPHSGDARCMSSSSTSRSYCSRSLLLENGSPQSLSGTFSV